jgi:hypothetical protein
MLSDFASRYLFTCDALSTTQEVYAFIVFERVFKEFGLSELSVWWLHLGIAIERIKPGHPEQNGRHDRMHLTLKKEATKPATHNFLQQQARSGFEATTPWFVVWTQTTICFLICFRNACCPMTRLSIGSCSVISHGQVNLTMLSPISPMTRASAAPARGRLRTILIALDQHLARDQRTEWC